MAAPQDNFDLISQWFANRPTSETKQRSLKRKQLDESEPYSQLEDVFQRRSDIVGTEQMNASVKRRTAGKRIRIKSECPSRRKEVCVNPCRWMPKARKGEGACYFGGYRSTSGQTMDAYKKGLGLGSAKAKEGADLYRRYVQRCKPDPSQAWPKGAFPACRAAWAADKPRLYNHLAKGGQFDDFNFQFPVLTPR